MIEVYCLPNTSSSVFIKIIVSALMNLKTLTFYSIPISSKTFDPMYNK